MILALGLKNSDGAQTPQQTGCQAPEPGVLTVLEVKTGSRLSDESSLYMVASFRPYTVLSL